MPRMDTYFEDIVVCSQTQPSTKVIKQVRIPACIYKNAGQAWLPIIMASMSARGNVDTFERRVIVGLPLTGSSRQLLLADIS